MRRFWAWVHDEHRGYGIHFAQDFLIRMVAGSVTASDVPFVCVYVRIRVLCPGLSANG